MVRSMLAEALATATYLRNRSPTKAVEGKTPYEALYGVKPREYLVAQKHERLKLDDKARKCIFLLSHEHEGVSTVQSEQW